MTQAHPDPDQHTAHRQPGALNATRPHSDVRAIKIGGSDVTDNGFTTAISPEEVTMNTDIAQQPAGGEDHRPPRIIPDRATFQRMQALEDAIDYRKARAAAPCPNCHPDAEGGRCDDHAVDIYLITAYRRTASELDQAMTAARRGTG